MYSKIKELDGGRFVLVWVNDKKEEYSGTPAISKAMPLDVILDEDGEMDHIMYLIKKYYKDEQESAIKDFQTQTAKKIKDMIKAVLGGAHSAARWLFCHQEILTDKRVTEAIEKYDGKPRIDKLLRLDKESREFVEKTFGIKIEWPTTNGESADHY